MDKKTRLIIIGVLSIIIVILLSLGLTKAFMKPVEQGGNLTEISLDSCAKIKLTGTSSINLSSSYPMSRNRGLQTTPYSLTVTSYCDSYVGFNLYIATLNTNTLTDENIHYILTEKGSKTAVVEGILSSATDGSSDFSDTDKTELNTGLKGTYGSIYKIHNTTVALKGNKQYDLYLFVDESSTNTSMNKTFKAGVAVKAYDREKDQTLAEYVISQYTGTQGENGIYYHNSSLENGAGDNSYRYAGGDYVLTDAGKATGAAEILAYNDDVTSLIDFYCGNTKHFFGYTCGSSDTFYYIVKGDTTHYKTYNEALTVSLARGYLTKDLIKNYVCFDTNESPCPTDNLYRIIGVIGDKVKLIKYDYATKDMLLSNGLYNEDVVASTDAYSSFYKGTLSNISLYYAGSETALAYNLNETKKVQKLSRKNELAVGDPCSGEKIKLNETALGVINLNTNYYGLLSNDSKNKIVNNDWFINSVSANKLANSFTIYTSEYDNSEKTTVYSAYIGLMYLSDYAYANSLNLWATEDYKETINSNWMYMGVQEGVITYFDTCNPYSIRWDGTINSIGYSSPIAIRPTFYLKSDVLYKSGIGTISSPIILKK